MYNTYEQYRGPLECMKRMPKEMPCVYDMSLPRFADAMERATTDGEVLISQDEPLQSPAQLLDTKSKFPIFDRGRDFVREIHHRFGAMKTHDELEKANANRQDGFLVPNTVRDSYMKLIRALVKLNDKPREASAHLRQTYHRTTQALKDYKNGIVSAVTNYLSLPKPDRSQQAPEGGSVVAV